MNPLVLNQSPHLEPRGPSHAEKRLLNLNKGKLKETEPERGPTGPRPLGKPEVRTGWAGLGRAVGETQACPVCCSVCLSVWAAGSLKEAL